MKQSVAPVMMLVDGLMGLPYSASLLAAVGLICWFACPPKPWRRRVDLCGWIPDLAGRM